MLYINYHVRQTNKHSLACFHFRHKEEFIEQILHVNHIIAVQICTKWLVKHEKNEGATDMIPQVTVVLGAIIMNSMCRKGRPDAHSCLAQKQKPIDHDGSEERRQI